MHYEYPKWPVAPLVLCMPHPHISLSCGQLLGHAHDGGVSKPWQMAGGGHPET